MRALMIVLLAALAAATWIVASGCAPATGPDAAEATETDSGSGTGSGTAPSDKTKDPGPYRSSLPYLASLSVKPPSADADCLSPSFNDRHKTDYQATVNIEQSVKGTEPIAVSVEPVNSADRVAWSIDGGPYTAVRPALTAVSDDTVPLTFWLVSDKPLPWKKTLTIRITSNEDKAVWVDYTVDIQASGRPISQKSK